MRRFYFVATFLLLVAAVHFMWQNRFERVPGQQIVLLDDIRSHLELPAGARWIDTDAGAKLALQAVPGNPIAVKAALPGIANTDYLHLRTRIVTRDLEPGSKVWEDGKCFITWYDPANPAARENDPVGSGRHDSFQDVELVMMPERKGMVPFFGVQNAGITGDLEISSLAIMSVRERLLWRAGQWILMAAFVAWMIFWMAPANRRSLLFSAVVSLTWLLMVTKFVVPGPWQSYRPLGPAFNVAGEQAVNPREHSSTMKSSTHAVADALAGPPAIVGEMPERALMLRVKSLLSDMKVFLHIGLLFPPVLLAAFLVGRAYAMKQGLLLSVAVEVAQLSFGFGCDWTDGVDLLCDFLGIYLALWLHHRLVKFMPGRFTG